MALTERRDGGRLHETEEYQHHLEKSLAESQAHATEVLAEGESVEAALQGELAATRQNIATLQEQMEDATNDRIEREETLRKEFNDLEQSKDAALESLSQKMALMQASLQAERVSEVSALQASLSATERQGAQEASSLSASLSATERRVQEAADYVAHLEKNIEEGNAHADELLQEGKVLEARTVALEEETSALHSANTLLSAEKMRLEAEASSRGEDVETLRAEADASSEMLAAVGQQLEAAQAGMDQIKDARDALATQHKLDTEEATERETSLAHELAQAREAHHQQTQQHLHQVQHLEQQQQAQQQRQEHQEQRAVGAARIEATLVERVEALRGEMRWERARLDMALQEAEEKVRRVEEAKGEREASLKKKLLEAEDYSHHMEGELSEAQGQV
ncbi:hypothetical protein T484DRAFT_1816930, partial [Baffinella frigidus]